MSAANPTRSDSGADRYLPLFVGPKRFVGPGGRRRPEITKGLKKQKEKGTSVVYQGA